MSVQLLDKTRKINQLLQNGRSMKVKFSDILTVLSNVLDGSTLVISKKGKILGTGGIGGGEKEEFCGLLSGKVGSFADPLLIEQGECESGNTGICARGGAEPPGACYTDLHCR